MKNFSQANIFPIKSKKPQGQKKKHKETHKNTQKWKFCQYQKNTKKNHKKGICVPPPLRPAQTFTYCVSQLRSISIATLPSCTKKTDLIQMGHLRRLATHWVCITKKKLVYPMSITKKKSNHMFITWKILCTGNSLAAGQVGENWDFGKVLWCRSAGSRDPDSLPGGTITN